MPVFPAIFEHVAGNLLSVDGSANTVASNIAGNIARCGCPFMLSCMGDVRNVCNNNNNNVNNHNNIYNNNNMDMDKHK